MANTIVEHMRALLLTDDGPRVCPDYPVPRPQAGEALIRVHLAGICATDLQLIAGYKGGYRGVLGHEFVGAVVAAPGNEAWIGRRVVGELNIGCGGCALCRRGLPKHCRDRQSLGIIGRDGAFADYLTLPVANLHAVPDGISDREAVFTEPLAAAFQILEQVHIGPESRVCLLGAGRLGLLVAQVLALTGCDLRLLVRTGSKDELLAELAIRPTLIDSRGYEALRSDPPDIVVDATGAPSGFERARRLVRPGGTLVLKSTFAGGLPHFDISSLVVDEITVVGSRCGPFEPALRALQRGAVSVESLIDAQFSLEDGNAALDAAAAPGTLKVLLAPFAPAT